MNVDVSPTGETLIFDLLGDLYLLPFSGGDAVPVTAGPAWDKAPRFSPDGKAVYFVSDRVGHNNIWRVSLSDQSLQQITASNTDIMGTPNFSQDGGRILAGVIDPESRDMEVILHSIDPNSGDMTPIDEPAGPWANLDTFEIFRPSIRIYSGVKTSGGSVYYSESPYDAESSRWFARIKKYELGTRVRTAITPPDASYSDYKPQLSRSGNLFAYFRQYNDRRTEVRILNRATGQDAALIELSNADDAVYSSIEDTRANYAFTPNEQQLVFWHNGKIHRVGLDDGSSETVPFKIQVERKVRSRVQPVAGHISDVGEAKVIRWPTVSRDGQRMTFTAIGYVWVMELQTGVVRRLTRSSDFEYMPALSPDGSSVAYISFTPSDGDYGSGRLMIADIDDGTPREVLADPNETYLLPKWSHDGLKIALIREVEGEPGKYDGVGGIVAAFGWTSVTSGAFREVAAAPASTDIISWFIYSRSVGFDETNDHLLFSFPHSGNETVLATARLDGGSMRTLAVGTSEVGGITPAPDLNNLALTRRDGTVWLVPFTVGEGLHEVSTLAPDARRVSSSGGYYVDWNGPEQITFGFGRNAYRQRLNEGGLESVHIKIPFTKPKAERPIAFTGARLITQSDDFGIGGVIESGTIVLRGQRIIGVGSLDEVTIPPDARVIDTTGKTIMPGLLDTHYHRIGGDSLSAYLLPNSKFSDPSAIAYGITTAWEPGGAVNDGVPAIVDLQDAGRITGPRWSHSATGGIGHPWEFLTTLAGARAAVEQHRELGVAVLKEYNAPTRQQRQWLSAAAREKGLGIVSHIERFDGMMTRAVDGFTGGDHLYVPVPFFKDVHELLRQTGYIWTPNVTIAIGSLSSFEDVRRHFWRELLEKRPGELEKLKSITTTGRFDQVNKAASEEPNIPYDVHRVSRVAEQAVVAAQNGVHVGVSAHNMPGVRLHMELWYLWKGGLPVKDLLRAATIGNAEKLGLQEEIGSLEPGKIADILILDDNPLEDIANTLSLTYTVQGGVVYDSATAQRVNLTSTQE